MPTPEKPTGEIPEPRRGAKENPFEDPEIAKLWTVSVEGEKGFVRERAVYPLMREWLKDPSIKSVLDIGAGQGVVAPIAAGKEYVGVEPSPSLVARAREQHKDNKFIVGNAYELPVQKESFDAAFSINVWFHLADLDRANKELSRVLKQDGKFLIISANPDAYATWKSFFKNVKEEGKRMEGSVEIPLVTLPRNVFYRHTRKELLDSFDRAGLEVEKHEPFAPLEDGTKLFEYYQGFKKS